MRRWWALGVLVVLWAPELAAAPTGRFPDPPGKAPNPAETTKPPPLTPTAPAPAAPAPAAPATAAPVPPPATESWATRSARLLTEQADALARRGEFARALTVYHQAMVMDPSFAEAYFGLGKLRQRQGDTREAERIYTQAARLRNGGAKAFELRARLRYISGRQLEALTDLAEALRLEPEDVPRLELASQWYVAQQAWPAALAVWRRLLAIYRDHGQADAARRAQIQVQALTMLAGDSDPVSTPNHSGWVPNALRHISLRGG